MQALPAHLPHVTQLRIHTRVRRLWELPLAGECSTSREQPQRCGCAGNHTANYRGCVEWKEAKAALAKQAPERSRKSLATGQPAAPNDQRAGPFAEQKYLRKGWNHVVRGGVSSRLPRHPPPTHVLIPPLNRSRSHPRNLSSVGRRPGLKTSAQIHSSTKRAFGKSKKEAAAIVKTAAATPTTRSLVDPT